MLIYVELSKSNVITLQTLHAHKQGLLLGPFQVHARLLREGCEHLLVRCSEDGHGAGRGSGSGGDEGSPDLLCCGHPDEHLVVHDAKTMAQKETS